MINNNIQIGELYRYKSTFNDNAALKNIKNDNFIRDLNDGELFLLLEMEQHIVYLEFYTLTILLENQVYKVGLVDLNKELELVK